MLGGGRIRGSASAGDESDTNMPMLTGPSERREREVPFRLAHFGPHIHIHMEKVLNAGGGHRSGKSGLHGRDLPVLISGDAH